MSQRHWSSRITITGEQITASQHNKGVFVQAMREEYARLLDDWRVYEEAYMMGKIPWQDEEPIDPDLEVDEVF